MSPADATDSATGSAAEREGESLRLHLERFPGRAVFDTALSHAMLRRVARGDAPQSLRLYRPDNALLFSSLDARRPGYPRAVELAREAGYEPVIRLAGGHAAVFLETAMAFAWASADPQAHLAIEPRFERLTGWIVQALRRLGLDARVGAVPGEYCPGEHSVNIGGRVKVMGVGQRVIRGGAHVGGVLTVGETAALREVLIPIYEALELEFRPETAGGIADFDPVLDAEAVIDAIRDVLDAEGFALRDGRFDEAIHEEARSLAPLHGPHRDPAASRALRPGAVGAGGAKALIQAPEPHER